ncbi:MAG: hypothetical protein AAGF73_05125 [Actinomycetota bacterium]
MALLHPEEYPMSASTITRSAFAVSAAALTLVGLADVAGARESRDSQALTTERSSGSPATFEFTGPTMMEFDPTAGDGVIGALDVDSPPPPPPGPSAGNLQVLNNGHGGNGGQWQAADDYKAGPGCSVSCITSGVAYQHGPDARLKVTTDTDAMIWILVWDNDGYYRTVDSGNYGSKEFEFVFDDVDLDSTYYAMAVAEDINGYSDHADGEFTTGERHVEIEFGAANVYVEPSGVWGGDSAAFVSGNVNSVGSLPTTTTRHDVDRYLDLAVNASVDRDPVDGDLCEAYSLQLEQSHYAAGNCYVRATVFGDDIDLDDRPANAGSGAHVIDTTLVHPGGGALPPGYGQELQYNVPVELTVWYG